MSSNDDDRPKTAVQLRGEKWTRLSYALLGVVFVLSIVNISVAGWALGTYYVIALPKWAVNCILAFAVLVMVFSAAGFYGTRIGMEKAGAQSWNLPLVGFAAFVFVALIVQLAASGSVLHRVGVVDDLKERDMTAEAKDLDDELRDWMRSNRGDWKDAQREWNCCGYDGFNSTTVPRNYPTGSPCGSNPPATVKSGVSTCRSHLLTAAAEQGTALGAVGTQLAFFEVLALIGAGCLIFGIRARVGDGDDYGNL